MASHAVVKTLTFAYGHRIRGHGGRCAHLHGHNARVEIECAGPLDELGMVVDFAEIKRVIEVWAEESGVMNIKNHRIDALVNWHRDAIVYVASVDSAGWTGICSP